MPTAWLARLTCPASPGAACSQAWNTPGYFEKVYITPHRAIAWDDDIELCADALYLKLTGNPIESGTERKLYERGPLW